MIVAILGEEDEVTLTDDMPNWLYLDRLTNKYVFCIDSFPFDHIPTKLGLNDKKIVKNMDWMQFNRATTTMIAEYYKVISQYYKSGISQIFRREFSAALSSRLPRMAKKYRRIRKASARGRLSPDLSKTVKSLTTYSVKAFFLFFLLNLLIVIITGFDKCSSYET